MSGGSWLNRGTDSIGTTPGYMGPWEKLQLGWLDYKVGALRHGHDGQAGPGRPGQQDRLRRPSSCRCPSARSPRSATPRTPAPASGGAAAATTSTSTLRPHRRPHGRQDLARRSARGSRATSRTDYDYLYGEVSTDSGANWTPGRRADRRRFAWAAEVVGPLGLQRARRVQFRFRVATDGGVSSEAFIDDIAVTVGRRRRRGRRRREPAPARGPPRASAIIDGTTTKQVAGRLPRREPRLQRLRRDAEDRPVQLRLGHTKPDWVERFPYQNGMLVWFANGEYADNNTIAHPGGGEVLPVDARPAPIIPATATSASATVASRSTRPSARRPPTR